MPASAQYRRKPGNQRFRRYVELTRGAKASAHRPTVLAKAGNTEISPVLRACRRLQSKCPSAHSTGESRKYRDFASTESLPEAPKQVPIGPQYWRKQEIQRFRRYVEPAGGSKASARKRTVPAKAGEPEISPVQRARTSAPPKKKKQVPAPRRLPGSNSGCHTMQ